MKQRVLQFADMDNVVRSEVHGIGTSKVKQTRRINGKRNNKKRKSTKRERSNSGTGKKEKSSKVGETQKGHGVMKAMRGKANKKKTQTKDKKG